MRAPTCGGNAGGAPCLFPFTYKGVKHTSCTTLDNGGQPWCYTETATLTDTVTLFKTLPLTNGWQSYGSSGSDAYGIATYTKTAAGVVFVEGLVKNGGWGLIATLPAGYRPSRRLIFNLNSHAETTRVDVETNGNVLWVAGGKGEQHWVSLSGISFTTNYIKVSGGNDADAIGLAKCTGECDSDSQCAFGLKCFERDNGEAIPGCDVTTAPLDDWDYCYDPADSSVVTLPLTNGWQSYNLAVVNWVPPLEKLPAKSDALELCTANGYNRLCSKDDVEQFTDGRCRCGFMPNPACSRV